MLAYRHAFHAGNHADVLKHIVLIQVLRYLGLKDKPYWFIDTHAGAGAYALDAAYARKRSEFAQGIGRLWPAVAGKKPSEEHARWPEPVQDYLAVVKRFNDDQLKDDQVNLEHGNDGRLLHYPGSPAIARSLMRSQDRMRLFELHPTDHGLLDEALGRWRACQIQRADGFAGLKSLLPPPPRRALVLLDPSYEIKDDYGAVLKTLGEGLDRFPDGVYMVWYPQVPGRESDRMAQQLKAAAASRQIRGWVHATMTVQAPGEDGYGLRGSGVFVLNPPYVLRDAMAETLPFLTKALAQYDGAHWQLEHQAA